MYRALDDALRRNDLAAFKAAVVAHPQCDKYSLVNTITNTLVGPPSFPYIRWLFATFALNAMQRDPDKDGELLLLGAPLLTLPVLCEEYGFDVNAPIGGAYGRSTYVEDKLFPRSGTPLEVAQFAVYYGARKTPAIDPRFYPLFDARSRCAQAARALLAVLRSNRWRGYVARDVALIMTRMVWRTRCEWKGWL